MGYKVKMDYTGRNNITHPTLNQTDFIENFIKETRNQVVVNVGSGPLRPIPHAINVDFIDSYEVDSVSSAYQLDFDDASDDFVISIGLLEHVKYPQKAIAEFKRILKPNGKIYCEVPFLQPYHPAPEDYWRTTVDGLCTWLEDFEKIEAGFSSGPSSTVGWILRDYMHYVLPADKNQTAHSPFFPFLNGLIKYVDDFMLYEGILDFDKARGLASSIFFYGKKPYEEAIPQTSQIPTRPYYREQKLASYLENFQLCKQHINRFIESLQIQKKCAVYGSGDLAEMLVTCLKNKPLSVIIEHDTSKWGSSLLGIPIVSITDPRIEDVSTIIIASLSHKAAIMERLNNTIKDKNIHIVTLEI